MTLTKAEMKAIEDQLAWVAEQIRFQVWLKSPLHPQPPTEADLARKRDARLLAEELETLTPQERGVFDKLYGERATVRRLAQAAQIEADRLWEAREQEQADAAYKAGMWQGHPDRTRLPGADYDKLFEQSEAIDQRRASRLEARKQRELAAEIHDEERARVLASLDRDELEIFSQLMDNLPPQLERLRAFKNAAGHNELEGITDTATLYEMALQSDPATRRPAAPPPDVSGIDDPKTLYDIALQQLEEE